MACERCERIATSSVINADELQLKVDLALAAGKQAERERIIKLLFDLDVIRFDVFDHLVAMDTHGAKCIYLTGL